MGCTTSVAHSSASCNQSIAPSSPPASTESIAAEDELDRVPVIDFSDHSEQRPSHSLQNPGSDTHHRCGSPASAMNSGSVVSSGSGATFSVHSQSTSSRKSEDAGTNPLILASNPPEDQTQPETGQQPPSAASSTASATSAVALNSLSVFSPTALCDRSEFVRRYRGGFCDDDGLHFPTPEERHSTLESELLAASNGGTPAEVITGRGTLWVHPYLNDGLPVPLEAFRGELYDASDNTRLARFQHVVEQITGLCLRLLLRRSSVLDIDMCLARANDLVKQSGRTPCTDRLKAALQQQVVKLHDLRVAVQSPGAILSALRYDDFNHLRTIFNSRVDAAVSKEERRARRKQAATVSFGPAIFASFTDFMLATLRDYVVYSLLTTMSIASQPPPPPV